MTWLKQLFKKKEKPVEGLYNIHHPDIAPLIEVAFECGGVTYYRMKEEREFNHRVGRYKFINAYTAEAEIRMSIKTLQDYIKELKKHLDGARGNINLDKAFRVIHAMETRAELAFEPGTIKRLASVVYFDETEDLRDFDEDYGRKKIELWEKHDCYAFFLTRPMNELLNLQGISLGSLKKYIQEAESVIKSLTLEQPNPSEESL